jgi:uncharacterized membrane protein YhaH (DUF805 family)
MSFSPPIRPAQAVQAFYRKRFDFESRSRRSEFWWVQLIYLFFGLIAALIDIEVLGYSEEQMATPVFMLLEIALLIPMTALTARRLHDVGLTGWAQLPTFFFYIEYIPGYEGFVFGGLGESGGLEKSGAELGFALLMCLYLFWLIFYLVKDGEGGANRFGENPKEPSLSETFD